MSGRLDKKIALVTGGASGLGRAIAQRLAADGASVVITDIQRDLGDAAALADGFTFLEHDVCDEARWNEVIREVEARFERLNILVNSAGITGPMDAVTPENSRLTDWKRVFSVNVESVFLGCRAAIPVMRRTGGGSIVNLSSISGLLASPAGMAYGASKAAVRQLTKSVAQYCAQEKLNIRCNSVHPGPVLTPLLRGAAENMAQLRGVPAEEILAEMKANIPLGEFSLPEDVAAMVAFLASDDSRQITGAKLIVDGGRVNCDSYRPVLKKNMDDSPSYTKAQGF